MDNKNQLLYTYQSVSEGLLEVWLISEQANPYIWVKGEDYTFPIPDGLNNLCLDHPALSWESYR